jgi:hypothetical protein
MGAERWKVFGGRVLAAVAIRARVFLAQGSTKRFFRVFATTNSWKLEAIESGERASRHPRPAECRVKSKAPGAKPAPGAPCAGQVRLLRQSWRRFSVVRIGGVGGEADLFGCLREKFLGPSCVTAQIVIVVFLGFVNFFPSLPDELLGSAHVSVSFTNVYRRSLRKQSCAKRKSRAERDAYHQDSLRHGFVLPRIAKFCSWLSRPA